MTAAPRRRPSAGRSRPAAGAMAAAPATFDDWLAARTPAHRRFARTLRALVARVAPTLVESVKWTNGCWLLGKAPVCYLHAAADHLQFGFFRGAALTDPLRLLRGSGQYVRHVKVCRAADVDAAALTALVREAAAAAATQAKR